MKKISAADVHDFMTRHYRDRLPHDDGTLPEDTDLLESGIIDSFGILELVEALERHFAVTIDLEDLAPEKLTVVGPLCAYVAATAVAAPAAPRAGAERRPAR